MAGRDCRRINQVLYTLPFPVGVGNMAAGGGTIKAEQGRSAPKWEASNETM